MPPAGPSHMRSVWLKRFSRVVAIVVGAERDEAGRGADPGRVDVLVELVVVAEHRAVAYFQPTAEIMLDRQGGEVDIGACEAVVGVAEEGPVVAAQRLAAIGGDAAIGGPAIVEVLVG